MILPTPFIPNTMLRAGQAYGTDFTDYAAALWPAANRAIYVPFILPLDATVYGVNIMADNATGNFDIGLYNSAGAALARKGSTAMADDIHTLSVADIRLHAGETYYAAVACSSASGSIWRTDPGSTNRPRQIGIYHEESALPLPATMTPADATASYIPLFSLSLR